MILYFEEKYSRHFGNRSVFPKIIEDSDGKFKLQINLAGNCANDALKTSEITNVVYNEDCNIYEVRTSGGNSKWVFIGNKDDGYQNAKIWVLDNGFSIRPHYPAVLSYDEDENILLEYNGKLWNMGKIVSSKYEADKTISLVCENNFVKFYYK